MVNSPVKWQLIWHEEADVAHVKTEVTLMSLYVWFLANLRHLSHDAILMFHYYLIG